MKSTFPRSIALPAAGPAAGPRAGLTAGRFAGLLAGLGLLAGGSAVLAERMPEMDAEVIRRVTADWQGRVFLVVADAGTQHVPVQKVLENPRVLYRKRRVGCAVFLGSGRYLLTTASVTSGGSEVEIFDADGRNVLARVIGADPFLDLALLETIEDIPGTADFDPLVFGAEPTVGQPCIVLGNAYGRDVSVALGRLTGVIEISPGGVPTRAHRVAADIYPGDSGALVLDAEGRFVGLVTGVSAPGRHPVLERIGEIAREDSAGWPAGDTGFAVPSRECRRAWMDLRDFGHVRRGYLGVHIAAVDEHGFGARVLNVTPGGPADLAGLHPGDLVTTFGDLFVRGGRQLCAYVASAEPFVPIGVHVQRDGREQVVTVTVGVTSELPKLQHIPLDELGLPPTHPAVKLNIVPVGQ